jgi:hypothetical protein
MSVLDATDFVGILQNLNDAVNGYFGASLLILIMIVMLMVFGYERNSNSFMISSFVGLIVGLILLSLELITIYFLGIPILILFFSIMYKFFGG